MTDQPKEPVAEDSRLERLLDYTKFHIGIYLSAAGGILVLVGSEDRDILKKLEPHFLLAALLFMLAAGAAGGVIASCTTQCRTFEELWDRPQGPHKARWLKGQTWALIEHSSFWVSVLLLIGSTFPVIAGFWSISE